jgi:hypothetical protein
MTANTKERAAFRDCLAVLNDLEKVFRLSGADIELRLGLIKGKDRYVEILCREKPVGLAFVDGCSPVQVIKKVAREVPL